MLATMPFVSFAQSLDPRLLVSLYLRFYPLLDQTYKQIGHPTGRFHDRVIVAIDDMLAAPHADRADRAGPAQGPLPVRRSRNCRNFPPARRS